MKRTLLLAIIALMGIGQLAAQAYEYVPFVREGVKWVYYYDNPFGRGILDMDEGIQYFSFEMKGDVLIGDKYYKPVVLTHYLGNGEKVEEDFIPVYLREENKVVYAIHPDGKQHPQCPVFFYYCITSDFALSNITGSEEYVLYDFNNVEAFYSDFTDLSRSFGVAQQIELVQTDTVTINGHHCKRHHFDSVFSNENRIIESIGYDGSAGMPLFYFEYFVTGFQVRYYLSHVLEDGEIIYKGQYYNPDTHVGIDEVAADRAVRPADGNYYNLMGQPMGKDVPTVPGIYIHQGCKIVVR